MKNKFNDKDFDFSSVDLTKVPLNELDYYAKNSSLTQIVDAICKIMKKMGLVKEDEEKTELNESLSTVSNSYIIKTKDIKDFHVGKFVDQQDLDLSNKVILNHKLQKLENDRQLAQLNSDELVLDNDYSNQN